MGCPSSRSVVQVSQCPQVRVVLVPWVCLWTRERMWDSKGARQSKELDHPCISSLPSDSSASLVGEKMRLGITRILAKEMEEFRDSSLNLQQEDVQGTFPVGTFILQPLFEFSFAFISSFPTFREL